MRFAMPARTRGRFLVFEGIDGSGQTTQVGQLAAWLQARGESVLSTREPSRGPIGQWLRQVLAHQVAIASEEARALLFAADRLDHVAREITPALDAGRVVISDRYFLSSYAYQTLTAGLGWLQEINALAPWPDLTFFLDVPVEVCLQRLAERGNPRELYEQEATLATVRGHYLTLIADAQAKGLPIEIVDGRGSIEEVARAVREGYLWHFPD